MQPITEDYLSQEEISAIRCPRGRIRTTVRGSHVNITVRLHRIGIVTFNLLVSAAAVGLVWVTSEIIYAIASGRVHHVLQQIQKAGR